MNTYQATIRLPSGSVQKVTIQADTSWKAKEMLELQYGKGSVLAALNRVTIKGSK
jgi:hypothetical protein